MDKEEVFSIMGKYYGNAHFRIPDLTAKDAECITIILNKINELGYAFSNLHKLEEVCDERFIDIIIDSYYNYADYLTLSCKEELICGLSHKAYKQVIPFLLQVYNSLNYEEDYRLKYRVSDVISHIRDKSYEEEYIKIINSINYNRYDEIYCLLCNLKSRAALKRIIELVRLYPNEFKFVFLQSSWKYKNLDLIVEYQKFLNDESGEIRTMAKKAIKKVEN